MAADGRGLSSGRALLWVAVAVAAGGARARRATGCPARVAASAALVVAVPALLAALVVSGAPARPAAAADWDELVDGRQERRAVARHGPAPVRRQRTRGRRCALQLLGGALLLTVAALLACWPRARGARGYPFLALAALLVLVVSPVVSLGGTRPLLLGVALAGADRLLPVARAAAAAARASASRALLGVALAGALPLAAVADRGEPWFDYKAFAEGLGPDDPVRFRGRSSTGRSTGRATATRSCASSPTEPHYWKAANLERFDGSAFGERRPARARRRRPDDRAAEDWRNQPGWLDDIEVSIRRMRVAPT